MNTKKKILTLSALLTVVHSSLSYGASDKDLIDQFKPQSSEFDSSDTRVVSADLDNSGRMDYLVAAYTDGSSCALKLLKKTSNGSASLAAEVKSPKLKGFMPRIRLKDLDGDQRPEIILATSDGSARNSTWIFKWKGNELSLISPTVSVSSDHVQTLLSDPQIVDLNGDGKLTILNGNGDLYTAAADGTYSVNSVKSVAFSGSFKKTSLLPKVQAETFDVTQPKDHSFILKVTNGELSTCNEHEHGKDPNRDKNRDHHLCRKNRTESAKVFLNGKEVVGHKEFKKSEKTGLITITSLTLQEHNTIKVEDMRGPEGSSFRVMIMPSVK